MALLGAGDDVDVVDVPEDDALAELRERGADCAVLPARRARRRGVRAARAGGGRRAAARAAADRLHAGAAGRRASAARLEELAGQVNAKAVSSPERLVDETALFLHRMEANLPSPTRKLLAQLRTADSVFHGKRILIVDDDIRNVFALTSALEMRGMKVAYAENGREGVDEAARGARASTSSCST